MTDVETDGILIMFRCVDLIGSWKALSWVSRELEKDLAIEDLTDSVNHALSNIHKELGVAFEDEHFQPSMRDIVRERMKEKVEAKP